MWHNREQRIVANRQATGTPWHVQIYLFQLAVATIQRFLATAGSVYSLRKLECTTRQQPAVLDSCQAHYTQSATDLSRTPQSKSWATCVSSTLQEPALSVSYTIVVLIRSSFASEHTHWFPLEKLFVVLDDKTVFLFYKQQYIRLFSLFLSPVFNHPNHTSHH